MARRLTVQRYPLLKFALPFAILVAAVGLFVFFTSGANTYSLLPYLLGAVVIALLGVAVRRKETVSVLLPSDTLDAASRGELQKLLDGLEEARRKGELSEERYQNARDRVLSKMGAGSAAGAAGDSPKSAAPRKVKAKPKA